MPLSAKVLVQNVHEWSQHQVSFHIHDFLTIDNNNKKHCTTEQCFTQLVLWSCYLYFGTVLTTILDRPEVTLCGWHGDEINY